MSRDLVRAYEQAGAQCIQLEDQVSPKRCGHMEGKEVIPLPDAAAKIRAAVDARSSTCLQNHGAHRCARDA